LPSTLIGRNPADMAQSAMAERIAAVERRIAAAARAAGRPREGIRLIAVSKGHPASAVREAYDLGVRVFGENYAKEISAKAEEIGGLPGLVWHFIGHLQSNKARVVAPIVDEVDSVDSVHLAAELGRRAAKAGRVVRVLVEVNVATEEAKSGCAPQDLEALLHAVEAQPALALGGLMTIPPLGEEPEQARRFFGALRALRSLHGGPDRLPDLSMGMSADLEIAIAEGATMVRVGTAIFGERPLRQEPSALQ
jgi:pyridoxal phosphate enzyme (YggS family)